ncbi:DUF882 domain-containing protein [Pendulispora brunnea]|uniref:Murein endopeptidase K n=1 Tax=Pendulispora brunnea TaxID=2905690 RepID=A0ABZ2KSJ1_9BACT
MLVSTVALAAAPTVQKPKKTSAKAAQQSARMRSWHTPTPNKAPPVDEEGRPKLALYSLNTNDRVEMAARSDHGGFSARDLDRAAHVLRDSRNGCEHPMDPRLLDLAYRIQTYFHAQELRIVSAYRAPRRHRKSNHGLGRALDMIVPGASDEEVAKFARELGFVGIGVYPASGFVHVDVRSRSYFWVDRSGPGRRNRERGILGDLAARSDSQAVTRGERPSPPFAPFGDVDAWLRTRPSQAAPATPDEDDDEETMENGNGSPDGAEF